MYPNEWKGSTDSKEGSSFVKIDGVEFSLELNSFEDHQILCMMLDMAFDQGKSFGSDVMRSHITKAMEDANRNR